MQLELDFGGEFICPVKTKKKVNYKMIFEKLKEKPLSFSEIQKLAGVDKKGASQVITTLTLNYPVWSPARGLYKVCEETDYQTVDWSKLYVE